MTPRERAVDATWDTGGADWTTVDRKRLESRVEQAIIDAVAEATAEEARKYLAEVERQVKAAVDEDRKARPHRFVGSLDRYCEWCNEPDRHENHLVPREWVSNAEKQEREACARILRDVYESWVEGDHSPGEAFESAFEKIRYGARSTASTGGEK